MPTVVSMYRYAVDLASTAAVPRLHAQLLTLLAAAHPDWDVVSVSPEANPLPGVESIAVPHPPEPRRTFDVRKLPIARRLARPVDPVSAAKSRWAEVAATRLAAIRPDGSPIAVICSHPETAAAARRARPDARILLWIENPIPSGFAKAVLATDGVVTPSVASYRDSWNRLGERFPAPLWVIPNWVDAKAFHPATAAERHTARAAFGLTDDDLVIAFIDRDWIKGGRVVEQALAALTERDRRVVLLIAGNPMQEHRVLLSGHEVWNLGVLTPDELRNFYGAADLGVVPSVCEEVFSVAAIEMMASGLPVVASRVGGLPEFVEDGVTGLLVDIPNAVDGWADAITRLLADAGARAALGQRGRAAVVDRHSTEQAEQSWTRVLSQLGIV